MAGSMEDYDLDDLQLWLAALLRPAGIQTADIGLAASLSSVKIVATISPQSHEAALAAAEALRSVTIATLALALQIANSDVVAMGDPTIQFRRVLAPSPPPPFTPPPSLPPPPNFPPPPHVTLFTLDPSGVLIVAAAVVLLVSTSVAATLLYTQRCAVSRSRPSDRQGAVEILAEALDSAALRRSTRMETNGVKGDQASIHKAPSLVASPTRPAELSPHTRRSSSTSSSLSASQSASGGPIPLCRSDYLHPSRVSGIVHPDHLACMQSLQTQQELHMEAREFRSPREVLLEMMVLRQDFERHDTTRPRSGCAAIGATRTPSSPIKLLERRRGGGPKPHRKV